MQLAACSPNVVIQEMSLGIHYNAGGHDLQPEEVTCHFSGQRGGELILAYLARGGYFGEIALLRRTKRSGTVTATRKTKLLALDAQDFHALIERLPDLAAHVKDTAEARLATAQTRLARRSG